jgi:protein-S-isoprenylcysteine O-methyltransferase Ste14
MYQIVDYKPPRIAMSLILLATLANALRPLALHPKLSAAALITALLGFALIIRAWRLFKQTGTAICPTAIATTLVTHDVFSVTRNPMYVGIVRMLLALALATGSAAFYAAAIAFGIVIDRIFCPHEKRKSVLEFGDQYREYARRVRRWI